jgi:class 3 adenylate cyclase
MTAAVSSRIGPTLARRHELVPPLMGCYLVLGLALVVGFYALPPDDLFHDTIYYPFIGLASVAAIVAATIWHRPPEPLPWLLFAAGLFLFVVGDVVFGIYEHVLHESPFPSAADALYLCGYPVLATGLWLLVRQRSSGRDWPSLIDGATIVVALGVVAWELLIVPYTADDSLSTIEKVSSIAYPLGDVLLLAFAVRLLLDSAARTVSYVLIGLALLCLLIADPLYIVFTIRGDYGSGNLLDVGWLLAYLLWGAAALHPSMRAVSEPAPEIAPRLTPARIGLLATAALTAPAILAYKPERLGVACSAILILLVGARMAGIVGRHERAVGRESRLRAAAATLVAATSDEEIHRAAVETAVAFAGGEGVQATLSLAGLDGPVALAGEPPDEGVAETFPLTVRDENRGALEVRTVAGVAREDRLALETLAAQSALALETVARAREKADAERARVRDVFSRFVPEAVVEQLLAQTGGSLRLGGETLHGTIMFTDLRGFTSFSESRPAQEVISVINRFLSEQTETIMAHGGTIIAYLGDGIMAAFGAPIEQADHADRALRAARELVATRLPSLNEWMRAHGYGDGFRMGIGLNSGPFISGNVGHERRLEYTAIGDVCNTASRIQELTKGTRHMLLFSDATRACLACDPDDLVDVGDTAIRGRQAAAKLWSLEAISDAVPASRRPRPKAKSAR